MKTRTIKLSKTNAYAFMEEGLRRYKSLTTNEEVAGIRIVGSGYEVEVRSHSRKADYMPSESQPQGV